MKKLYPLTILAMTTMLVSCSKGAGSGSGGLGSDGSTTPGGNISAQFIDAPVKGLNYEDSDGNTDVTGDNGSFSCKLGEEVTFRIKDLEIGVSPCSEKMYIDDVAGANADAAGAILQTFAEETGGVLDLTTFNTNAADVDFTGVNLGTINDGDIAALIPGAGPLSTLTAVTKAEARTHINDNLPDLTDDIALQNAEDTSAVLRTFTKVSGTGDCWDNISALIQIERDDIYEDNSKYVYRLKVDKYIGHDAAVDVADHGALTCDGNYQETAEGDEYECSEPEISQIISSRTLTSSDYFKTTISATAGQVIGCVFGDVLEPSGYVLEDAGCGIDPGTDLRAKSDYSIDFAQGYSFSMKLTESGFAFGYKEKGNEISADLASYDASDEENPVVNIVSDSYDCSYAFSETYEE